MVFENIKKNLDNYGIKMGLTEQEKALLLSHKQVKHAKLTVNGNKYDAWRIIHNNSLGPAKGGIRFHPNVSEDEVKSLSFWMSLKNSLVKLPYGGSKGGVKVDPRKISKLEKEQISREYIKAFSEFIGENKDIPAPDVNTDAQVMAWMLDEYEKIISKHEPAMITGKPIELGGCSLRERATGKGGAIILKQFLKKQRKEPEEIQVAIQGFGNVGRNIAKILHDEGYNIIAVSDVNGGIFNSEGLDIEKVIKHSNDTKSVVDFKDSTPISNNELLTLNVDVLIPAALENQITIKNVEDIKAKYILELANGPITSQADEILFKKGIIVIPDILANSGGVVVSYCEWSQNKTGNIFTTEEMGKVLDIKMNDSFHRTYELYLKEKISLREAAYTLAINRILAAEKARGNL